MCGNSVLLTSHTLFSRSYKPLMPQKMLNLLWSGTAESLCARGRGNMGIRASSDPLSSTLSLALSLPPPPPLSSALSPTPEGFGLARFSGPMLIIQWH